MKISVVIPAYNVEHVLDDAVQSVLNQTEVSSICEIIIVNDGSKDQTLEVMKDIQLRVHDLPVVLIDQINKGASAARNAGMNIAKGDWIALLDADDEWKDKKIEIQVNTIMSHPEIDFLGCQHDGLQLHILSKKIDSLYKATIKDLCIKSFPVTPAIMFKKDMLEKAGFFDESQKYMEDAQFCLRMCEHGNYYHLPDSLVRTGHGKAQFGASGLSSNLKGMQAGCIKNIKELKERHLISISFYCFLRIFYAIKYVRRISIAKLKKHSSNKAKEV